MVRKIRKPVVIAVIATVIILLLAVIGFRIWKSNSSSRGPVKETQKVPVVVEKAAKGEILKTIIYPGDLHAKREAKVYPPVAGRVIHYNYREGDSVNKGATVVSLDREEKWNKYKPVLIDAPISGKIAEIYLEAGDYATTATSLFLVIEDGPIRATMHVPDPDLRSIRPGMEALLTVPSVEGKPFSGTVTRVAPFIESETRTGEIQAEFTDNDSSLMPGMYGDVTIVLDRKKDALVVPSAALLYEEETNKPYVYVITDDHAAKKPVQTGITGTDTVEIVTGLTEGDRVVVTGKENLSDGTPAAVVEEN
jgi:multidrug efflux pump subunit AcrA (membrane-fusion protein)